MVLESGATTTADAVDYLTGADAARAARRTATRDALVAFLTKELGTDDHRARQDLHGRCAAHDDAPGDEHARVSDRLKPCAGTCTVRLGRHRYSCRLSLPRVEAALTAPDARSEGFLYRRLAAALRSQIDHGALRAGDRLPSVRTVRRLHHVSAATAAGAYLVLEREGAVEARERSGFYVARPSATGLPATLTPPYTPERVDVGELISAVLRSDDERLVPLGLSSLAPELLPTARLNRALRRAMAREPLHSASYGAVGGAPPLRRQLARLLINSGVTCSAEDLIVTAGGLEALNLALRTVTEPATSSRSRARPTSACCSRSKPSASGPSKCRHIREHGVDLAMLERAIRRHRAKAAVVMTTCHNPLGSVMTDAAKQELVAARHADGRRAHRRRRLRRARARDPRPRPAKAFDRWAT